MWKVLPKIPSYYFFRLLGWPQKLPINLTLSVTYKCNSRCKTCNIYKKDCEELSLLEWKKIFQNLGDNPFWVTISGGEPFLREDLSDLVFALYEYCKPSVINIPTNGLLTEKISSVVDTLSAYCQKSQIVINVSIDDIREKHDVIRGVRGSYAKAIKTFSALKSIKSTNLSVGIHTVISTYNVSRIPQIYQHLAALHPDSYITEIAEEREELNTVGTNITPQLQDYARAVNFLTQEMKNSRPNKVGKITRAFRAEYYQMVKRVLKEHQQIIPCFAGFASAQIAPDGHVWMCCVEAKSVGNLRNFSYDFRKVWFSQNANILRRNIKMGKCHCPLANASYTNILHNFSSLCRVGRHLIKMS